MAASSGTVLAIVPALNEEATVAAVVGSIRDELGADVLVIDDGSTDGTASAARAAGARVVRHPFNIGVGAALRTGFRFAAMHGYTTAVQVDADGQHDPRDAKALLDVVSEDEADIAVGSRFASGYQVAGLRRLGMRLLSRMVSRRLGVAISDTTSGYRAFGPDAISRFALIYPSQYLSDTVEALLLARDWNLRVIEVPVRMHPRQGGQASASPAKSTFHLLRMVFVVLLHRIRRPAAIVEARA